jgi:hypothetical protein
VHGDDGALGVVDAKAGGALELVKEAPQPPCSPNLRPEDNQRVIGILEHGAGGAVHERVLEHVVAADQALQHIRRDEEEVGGEGVPLPEPTHAEDPLAGDAIEEDGGARGREDVIHPIAPENRKPAREHDPPKAGPADESKALAKSSLRTMHGARRR